MSSQVSRGPLVSRVRLRPWWQPGTATASQDGDVVRYSRADPPPPPSQPARVAAGRSAGGRARGGASAAALSAGGGCAGVDHRVDRGPGPAHDRRPAGAHAHARTRARACSHAHAHARARAHITHAHGARGHAHTQRRATAPPRRQVWVCLLDPSLPAECGGQAGQAAGLPPAGGGGGGAGGGGGDLACFVYNELTGQFVFWGPNSALGRVAGSTFAGR